MRVKVLSRAVDNRINSTNLYVEISFGEYLSFARDIISNNDLQRKRVKTSKTVYSLLKDDLKQGCIMPPLVLALVHNDNIDPLNVKGSDLLIYMKENTNKVLILDGLQRTYTLIDAAVETQEKEPEKYDEFLSYTLRLEIYIGINKFGILYRMLTLNTGQTPMTARHQLEMLYKDLLNTNIGKIKLVTDVMDSPDPSQYEFSFKNVIDGFNSFLNRNELPIDREDLLENIKMLGNMSVERVDRDLFVDFVNCYAVVFEKLRTVSKDISYDKDDIKEMGVTTTPFGYTVYKVFSTSQALTGFGAAVGRMKDLGVVKSLSQISEEISNMPDDIDDEWFGQLIIKLDDIKNNAKKIGNAQRMYFHYFFRELLNPETDSYLKLGAAVETGYHKYYSQL